MAGRSARMIVSFAGFVALAACSYGGGGAGRAAPLGQLAAGGTATLSWPASKEPDLAGYRVYYGTAPGSYFQPKGKGISVGLKPSYVVRGLQPGQTYFFAVTSFDYSGNESEYSAEVSKLIN
jgi:hypothetical protein